MGRRMTIAFLSLVAGLTALYLHLYKLGVVGDLSCTSGGCDRAMYSTWGWFFGVDVALVGVVGYSLLLITSILSLQDRWRDARWPVTTLLVLALLGFGFTLRLKYGEFIVLRTFCPWCAISAVSITIITILAVMEFRRVGRGSTG
ncbi:MAG: vitamin K epoxide reductase family protein [Gemmatimonadota bacterium]